MPEFHRRPIKDQFFNNSDGSKFYGMYYYTRNYPGESEPTYKYIQNVDIEYV